MTAAQRAAADVCPRCNAAFHCGADDPGPCACNAVTLDAAMAAGLRLRYGSCLCVACLAALALPVGQHAPSEHAARARVSRPG